MTLRTVGPTAGRKAVLLRPLAALGALFIELAVWLAGRAEIRFLRGDPLVLTGLAVGLVLLGYVPLMMPRVRPWYAYLSILVLSPLVFVFPSYTLFTGLLVGIFLVALAESRRTAYRALALAAIPVAFDSINVGFMVGSPDWVAVLFPLMLWSTFVLVAFAAGRTIGAGQRTMRRQAAELTVAQKNARQLERTRIARELHDIVAHSLSGIVLQAAGAQRVHGRSADAGPQGGEALKNIEESAAQSMRELHRLLGLMRSDEGRPEGADDVDYRRLSEMDDLVAGTRVSGLDVEVIEDGTPTVLDPSVEHAAFRVVQEALSNAMKHGGRGADVRVRLSWQRDQLEVTVRETDGVGGGASAPSGGNGLAGLSDRVALVGGTFEAAPTGTGFFTRALLPATPSRVSAKEDVS